MPANARSLAASVVERVLADGAYLSRTLHAELSRHPGLDPRERALAAELSYGSVRCYGYLLERLEAGASRKLKRNDSFVLARLLVAAYQILLLSRVPDFAAVDSAVREVKRRRGPRVAGFCNALLRNLARQTEPVEREDAVWSSAPEWLRQMLTDELGEAPARGLLGAGSHAPTNTLRLQPGAELPKRFIGATPCRWAPNAYELPAGPLPGVDQEPGVVGVQEQGAQLIGWALGVRPGERVLDACAGRGGKTTLFIEQMQGRGELWATDAFPEKLAQLEEQCRRLGYEVPRVRAVDWTKGPADVPDGFDRVLVDAPCTGSGTLRRRPEIMLRLRADDPARLGQLQENVLRSVTSRLKVGGRLVYAVCSVLRNETEDVLTRVADILAPTPFDADLPAGLVAPGQSTLLLTPLEHGTDGYFVASLTRTGSGA